MFVKHGRCSIVAANRELIHLLLGAEIVTLRGATPRSHATPSARTASTRSRVLSSIDRPSVSIKLSALA